MDRIKIDTEGIYNNLILMAISRKQNFEKLVQEAEEETNNYIEDRKNLFIPKGFVGLHYIELLARKMGSSLGEVYNLSEIRREEIIRNLIQDFDPISDAYGSYFDEGEDGYIEFQGATSVVDVSDQKEILLYYVDLLRDDADVSEHNIYMYYDITFRKSFRKEDNTKAHYSISISGAHKCSSDYMYDDFEVWDGYEGYFADFIEKVISDYKKTHVT